MTRQERLTLVSLLLELDHSSNNKEVADAWESEIRARVKAVDEGCVPAIPYDQIQKDMTDRFGSG